MAHQVFISYSHKDRVVADALCHWLEEEKIRCWIAPRDIPPGENWASSIAEAIPKTDVMILIFSASANKSKQVQREVELAINNDNLLIPLRIEDVMPTGSMSYFLSTTHWIDAIDKKMENKFRIISERIKSLTGIEGKSADAEGNETELENGGPRRPDNTLPVPEPETEKNIKRKHKRAWIYAAVSIILIGVLFITIKSIMETNTAAPNAGDPAATASLSAEAPPSAEEVTAESSPGTAVITPAPGKGVISLYALNDEVPNIIKSFLSSHPDYGYTVKSTTVSTDWVVYQNALDKALSSDNGPDIYCAEVSFVTKYTQGEMSACAIPYANLGIDIYGETAAADIARYIVEVGTRPSDNAVVGLSWQSTGGAFIYRRSIAKKVWGTDEPAAVALKVGPGWDRFFEAASELKAKGYGIVSGIDDIWHPLTNSSDRAWIVDGKLYIDPKREVFLDYSKILRSKGYCNSTESWSTEWLNDISDEGPRKILGFFGPTWMINKIIVPNCGGTVTGQGTYGDWAVCEPPAGFFWGGTWLLANKNLAEDPAKAAAVAELLDWITLNCTENGLQYAWANGKVSFQKGTKDTVVSGKVMSDSDGTLPFLGGQDIYEVFLTANRFANGNNLSQYDDVIDLLWIEQVRHYAKGDCTRNEAIAAFKKAVKNQLGIDAL